MKDAYTEAFYDVVKQTQYNCGYELPHHIEAYIVMLLGEFVDRDDIPPTVSFAEQFLSLSDSRKAKELGDICLVVSGAFPHFKQQYGISRRYYQDIGATSYDMASDINDDLFPTLARHFIFLSEFIEIAVNSQQMPPSTLFR